MGSTLNLKPNQRPIAVGKSLTGWLVNKSLFRRLLISVVFTGKEQISRRASGPDICDGRESYLLSS